MEPRTAQLLIGLVACARGVPPAAPAAPLEPSPQALTWYLQGALLRESGDSAEAIDAFSRAAAFDPFDPAPLLAASALCLQRQEPAQALRFADEAAERSHKAAQPARAEALLALGRPAEALGAGGVDDLTAAAALLALGRPAEACARLAALPPARSAEEVRRRQPVRAAAACVATSG